MNRLAAILIKLAALVAVAVVAGLNTACAHVVRIDSAPGADIYVNDQHIGQAPAMYNETTGGTEDVKITAKLHGKEKTVHVMKDQTDMGAIGAGAGAGAGACLGINAAATVATFVFYPCGVALGLAACGALVAGPAVGWVMFGKKLPDHISVDLGDVPAPVADAETVAPSSSTYLQQPPSGAQSGVALY